MDVLVCIGGGGQHIALAVARMVRLGVWPEAPRMIVIDADLGSKLAVRLDTFAEPSDRSAPQGQGPTIKVPHPIRNLTMTPPLAVGAVDKTFRSSFLGAHGGGADNPGGPLEEELYELFYNVDADIVDIKQGMAARPSVGSAIFADRGIAHLGEILEGVFSHAKRIVVCASFIGGTGAGVTHQLVKYLYESPKRSGVDLFGAFLLPWIQLPDGKGAADDVTLQNSAKHGIQHFLEETAQRLRKSVFVGASGALPPAKANEEQDETVSAFPLLAVYGLTQMVHDSADAKVAEHDNVYTVTSGPAVDWLLQAEWEGPSIAVRWAAAKVFEELVRVFLDPADGVEFRQLTGVAFQRKGIFSETPNWGWAIRTVAKQTADRTEGLALAGEVLAHLQARTQQLTMVTSYLQAIFGGHAESALRYAGSDKLRSRYAQRQKLTKEQSYGYLAAAFRRCENTDWIREDVKTMRPAFIAKKLEEALMHEIVDGEVIK